MMKYLGNASLGALVALGLVLSANMAEAGYMTEVLADSPVAYYQLDETSANPQPAAADSSGNGLDGVYTNFPHPGVADAAVGVAGQVGNAALFDGIAANTGSTFIDVADNPMLDITGDLTLEAWINPEDVDGRFSVVTKYALTATGRSYGIWIDNGRLDFILSSDGGFTNDNRQTTGVLAGLTENTWHHVVATFDADGGAGGLVGRSEIFLNGTTLGTFDHATNAIFAGDASLEIGAMNSGATRRFDGLIDEVAVYGSVLSQARIDAHIDAVPEPASFVLLGLGSLLIDGVSRRRS